MRLFIASAIFLSVLVFAEELPNPKEDAIASQQASYDGEELKLVGDVILDHAFGKMTSEQAVLDKADSDKDFPFSRLFLQKKVVLELNSSGTLTCNEATLDFSSMQAQFDSKEGELVIFEDRLGAGGGKKKEFYLQAPQAFMKIGQVGSDQKKREYYIQNIEVIKNAFLKWDDQTIIEAPRLVFSKPDPDYKGKPFLGEVMAYASETIPCILRKEKDTIYANRIQLDMGQEIIGLAKAHGVIESAQFANQPNPIKFSADRVFWDQKKNTLTLQESVQCEDKVLGAYSTETSLMLFFEQRDEKKELKSLHAAGPAHLLVKDDRNQMNHKLFCPGAMDVQHQDMQAVLSAASGEQIQYSYEDGMLFSNKAIIDYCLIDGKARAVSIQLKGDVSLVSDKEEMLRCCSADRIQTSFETQSMVLYADSGKRVLFFDEEKGLNISALEVHITRDPRTHEEKIQGIGNVRFSFEDAEKEVLKKLHPKLGKKYG